MSGVTSAGEMNPLDGLVGKLQKIEEKRERIGWADEVQRVTVCQTLKPIRMINH
jgi:hypothetical protein